MLGRLSEPDKDSDPAIDGLQRPLRRTFRDFRFLRVHGTDAITASHGMHDSHGMQCGHGIHGTEGVYAGYGMGGIDAMDGSNSTSGINGVSGMDGIIRISAVSGTDGCDTIDGMSGMDCTAGERNGILLTDHNLWNGNLFYLSLQSERR